MTQNYFDEKKVEFSNLIDKSVLTTKSKFIDDRIKFLKSLANDSKNLVLSLSESEISEKKKLEISDEFHTKIKNEIVSEKESFSSENYEEDYKEFHINVELYINSLEETIEKAQSENNFICSNDNSKFICVLLKFKKLYFSLRHRKNKDYTLWKRIIPYKNINQFYFKQTLYKNILTEISNVNKKITDEYIDVYKNYLTVFENNYNKITKERAEEETETVDIDQFLVVIDKAVDNIARLENELSENLENHLTVIIENYKTAIEKAGTVEALFNKFKSDELKKNEEEIISFQNKNSEKLKNFNDGLFNNWNFFEDIIKLNYFTNIEFEKSKEKIGEKLTNFIIPKFESIVDLFKEIKENLLKAKQNNELSDFLKKEQKKLSIVLKENIVVEIVKYLPFENPAPLIEAFKTKLRNTIETLPDERTIANINDLKYGVEKSDFQKIPSKEIITKTIFNKTNQQVTKLVNQSNEKIKEISASVLDLSEISDYNFDTAISLLESATYSSSEKEKNKEDGFNVAHEGITRIIGRSNDLIKELNDFSDNTFASLKEMLIIFSSALFKLNRTDELTKQKIQLSKQKAQDEFKDRVLSAKTTAKNFIPIITGKIKAGYDFVLTNVFRLSERVGLSSQSSEATEEVLNYIIETEKQIGNLPLVYQRLYRNIPVDDERFFVGRDAEHQIIDKAYNNWENNKFAPVAVIGEKGAGASSLVNIAKKKLPNNYEIVHINLIKTVYKPDVFFKLISESLKIENIENIEDLIEKINSFEEKKIVIIENIEDLYLRIVNGFVVMKMFFRLLSMTHKKIFWISTCNRYAWNYLEKVINVDDYFAYIISFSKLSDNEIKDIIMKRHNMSGYKLKFLPDAADLNNKQFQKLSDEDKAIYLQNKFFEDLNKISQSNIGLAQLFWLRSIVSLSNNQIDIASLNSINFTFLKSLNKEKIFTLAALLIHDGLTVEEHAKVFNMSPEQSRLLLYAMFDDGEIRVTNDVYRINFLLYVHSIKLLKDQNILH